jgi:hypothetical protein
MDQLITPNPDIPCEPGWCLKYVRQTFGLPARYGSATEAWNNSDSQHRDRNFPPGLWLPVWYGIDREPLGHVVLMAPDGSVYSTSDNSTIPHHHPDLADLEDFYAGWGWPLTYRGWTEDVAGYAVIGGQSALAPQGTITPIQEDEMTDAQMLELKLFIQADSEARHLATRDTIVRCLSEVIGGTALDLKHFEQADSEARHLATRDTIFERLQRELAEGKLKL